MHFNQLDSLAAYFPSRRSARPREMGPPWPATDVLAEMVGEAARTPDHGKMSPWRFVIVPDDSRSAFAKLLEHAFVGANPDARPQQIAAASNAARMDAALIVVLSCPRANVKVPVWEQQLSAGAAVMNLLHAGHTRGFTGGWITGWMAYDPLVTAAFAEGPDERIAGFVYFGTPTVPLEERDRPDPAAITRIWTG